jgi:flavin reductase (DIM6/NTAB) family NADH-FMN oxidoreductase RutF
MFCRNFAASSNVKQNSMHLISEPAILYFGTPVILISTINEDGSYNLAPISSVFWLGWRCVIGISSASKSTANMIRTRECVINLPSADLVESVNALAKTTGSYPVPEGKKLKGYRYVKDKFAAAGLTPVSSTIVQPPRILECPVQMESSVMAIHELSQEDPVKKGKIVTIELQVNRVHIEESILREDNKNKIDPDKWRPLIMSFQEFYGLGKKIHHSTLAEIPEELYR